MSSVAFLIPLFRTVLEGVPYTDSVIETLFCLCFDPLGVGPKIIPSLPANYERYLDCTATGGFFKTNLISSSES
jgi:hypothetical protein